MFRLISLFLYIILHNNVIAANFQGYDPSKLTELSPPVIGSHLPYINFDNKNLPTVPIIQQSTNAVRTVNKIAIETITPEQIEDLNKKTEQPVIKDEKPVVDVVQNVNPARYHKNNILQIPEVQPEVPQNNNLTIIGSDGAIPIQVKPQEAPAIDPVPMQTTPMAPVLRNTYKLNIPKKESIIYTMTEKQKSCKNENLPELQLKSNQNIGWKRQVMPPNIVQKNYTSSNTHLSPVIFQTELDSIAFKYIINPNNCNILRALLEKISNVNIQDQNGNTLLIYSIYNFNHDAMIILLQKGANPNLYNDAGFSAIHLAANLNDDQAIKILLQYGADVNIVDKTGSTPIMYAALSDNIKSVDYLIHHGANVDIINNNGMDIMDFAKSSANKNIVDYLK